MGPEQGSSQFSSDAVSTENTESTAAAIGMLAIGMLAEIAALTTGGGSTPMDSLVDLEVDDECDMPSADM